MNHFESIYWRTTESPIALNVTLVPPAKADGVIVAVPVELFIKMYIVCPVVPAAKVNVSPPASASI